MYHTANIFCLQHNNGDVSFAKIVNNPEKVSWTLQLQTLVNLNKLQPNLHFISILPENVSIILVIICKTYRVN